MSSADSSYITKAQYDLLITPIHSGRVRSRDNHAYVEAHDIKAAMIRVFGFERWSWKINDFRVQREQEVVTKSTNKEAWCITALVHGTLTVCAPDGTVLATYDGLHAGASTHPQYEEAMGNAVTNADSYAFKRAAILALGDLGGLSLYNGGSKQAFVRWSLVPPVDAPAATVNTDDVPAVVDESEQVEDKREKNEPPAPPPPPAAQTNPELTKWVKTLLAGPDKDEAVAPFYARLHVAANKGKFLNALVENRAGDMVSAGALLGDEQKRTQRERAA